MYLACWFILALSRSKSKVKVIGQRSTPQEETIHFWARDARYEVMYNVLDRQTAAPNVHTALAQVKTPSCWLFVEFFCAHVIGATSSENKIKPSSRRDPKTVSAAERVKLNPFA